MEIRMSGDSDGSVDRVGGDISGGGAWSDSGASRDLCAADESAAWEACGLLETAGGSIEGGVPLLGMLPLVAMEDDSSAGGSLISTSSVSFRPEGADPTLTFFEASELIMGAAGWASSELVASRSILATSSIAFARMLS
jgi:hypothetical protein